jgi:hypothetical protein
VYSCGLAAFPVSNLAKDHYGDGPCQEAVLPTATTKKSILFSVSDPKK